MITFSLALTKSNKKNGCLKILKNKKGLTRDNLFKYLHKKNIQTNVHYIPIHKFPYYEKIGYQDADLSKAESYYSRCLNLPMYPTLTDEEQDFIIDKVNMFLNE